MVTFAAFWMLSASALGQGGTLYWKERKHSLDALPEGLPPGAKASVEAWRTWVDEQGYRMDLLDGGGLLLIAPGKNSQREKQIKLLEAVSSLAEQRTRPPGSSRSPAPSGSAKPAEAVPASKSAPEAKPQQKEPPPKSEELPEDPGSTPRTSSPKPPSTWGIENVDLGSQTAVIAIVAKEAELADLRLDLARRHPYLADWAARPEAGFVLADPLCGAYCVNYDGQEEWNPDSELVNRAARLLLMRDFGLQPNWVSQGWAWWVELELLDAVYCFPFRDEFVSVADHADWNRELEQRFQKRTEPLKIEEIANWRRGTYDDLAAKNSWGVVDFLVRRHPEVFPVLLEDLRRYRDEHNRIPEPGGKWRRDVDYEIPAAVQGELLRKLAGADFFERATEFFRTGGE
jgi:hypothetical protein